MVTSTGLILMIGAHAPYQGEVFESPARRMGLDIVKFAAGVPWPGNFRDGKLLPSLACVQSMPASVSHVLFADASDSLALAGPEEILRKFEMLCADDTILISGEKHCHPEQSLVPFHIYSRTQWRFVNSGGWMGRRATVQRALEWVCGVPHADDQLAWTLAFLKQAVPIQIDEECNIFQTMRRQRPGELRQVGKRIMNTVTGTLPCIAHWNGACHIEPLMDLQEAFNPGHVRRMPVALGILADAEAAW